MQYPPILILALLISGQIAAQDATATARPAFHVLSQSTVQQRDGSTITFQQVVPPVITPQAQPAAVAAVPTLSAAEQASLSQMPVKETKVLSISASVQANGYTTVQWTCGLSQRLQAVSNVDFRYLAGLGTLETEHASYLIILSAGPADEAMTDAETLAATSLPLNGRASIALLSGSSDTTSKADEHALDAMESLLEYFDDHREELVKQYAQREADRAAGELAALHAPPPPSRHSIIQFWPLQPAQRAAILEKSQRPQGGTKP